MIAMFGKKADIDPRIRAKFEKLGKDAVRCQLSFLIGVRRFDQQDMKEVALGDNLMASGEEMREWLEEQESKDQCWIRAGVILAGLAASFALLAWLFPIR